MLNCTSSFNYRNVLIPSWKDKPLKLEQRQQILWFVFPKTVTSEILSFLFRIIHWISPSKLIGQVICTDSELLKNNNLSSKYTFHTFKSYLLHSRWCRYDAAKASLTKIKTFCLQFMLNYSNLCMFPSVTTTRPSCFILSHVISQICLPHLMWHAIFIPVA